LRKPNYIIFGGQSSALPTRFKFLMWTYNDYSEATTVTNGSQISDFYPWKLQ